MPWELHAVPLLMVLLTKNGEYMDVFEDTLLEGCMATRKFARDQFESSFSFDVETSTQHTLIDFLPAPDVGLISAILVTTMS